jgi:hypothetical protein
MVNKYPFPLWVAGVSFLALPAAADAQAPAAVRPTGPAYQIVLRSRSAEGLPERNKDGQTAGGNVDVVQTRPDMVTFWMRGVAVAAAEQWKGGKASIHFHLHQEFEIVPLRTGLHPPRLSLEGVLIGTLQSTPLKGGGPAGQGPACASVSSGGEPLLQFCIDPHGVQKGQRLFVNDEAGPFELVVVPGGYCLDQSFDISAEQPYRPCPPRPSGAGAFFDPTPRLDARWSYLLNPFRAVPSRDFGFTAVIRVTEDVPPGETPPAKAGTERLPPPKVVNPTNPPAEGEQR